MEKGKKPYYPEPGRYYPEDRPEKAPTPAPELATTIATKTRIKTAKRFVNRIKTGRRINRPTLETLITAFNL